MFGREASPRLQRLCHLGLSGVFVRAAYHGGNQWIRGPNLIFTPHLMAAETSPPLPFSGGTLVLALLLGSLASGGLLYLGISPATNSDTLGHAPSLQLTSSGTSAQNSNPPHHSASSSSHPDIAKVSGEIHQHTPSKAAAAATHLRSLNNNAIGRR